jgi:hypothetical protein
VEALKPKPSKAGKVVIPKKTDLSDDLEPIIRYIESAQEGNRNNILYWGACRAAENGSLDENMRSALVSAGMNAGLDRASAEKTVASAMRKAGL